MVQVRELLHQATSEHVLQVLLVVALVGAIRCLPCAELSLLALALAVIEYVYVALLGTSIDVVYGLTFTDPADRAEVKMVQLVIADDGPRVLGLRGCL